MKTFIVCFLLLVVVVAAVGAEVSVDNKREGGKQERAGNYEVDERGRKGGGAWKEGGGPEATYGGVESEMTYPQYWGWGRRWGGPWGGYGWGGPGWGGWGGRGWGGWGGPGWGGYGWGGWRH